MDAFGNNLSIKTTLGGDAFFDLLDWFRTQVRVSSPLDWIELKEYSSSKVSEGMTVVLIHIDPQKAALYMEAWGELLEILGVKTAQEASKPPENVCTNCGFHSALNAKFCSVCGVSVVKLAKVG